MSAHVSSQIISAVVSRLSAVATVHVVPLHSVPIETLPAIVIENIEDETVEALGPGPVSERHGMSFEVFGLVAATSGMVVTAGGLRTEIEKALMSSKANITLDGLAKPGIRRASAYFRHDSESLQKPVGGWSMKFNCVYHIKTDAPDTVV